MEVEFCRRCRKIISKAYLFCPFCGQKNASPPGAFQEVLDQSLDPLFQVFQQEYSDQLQSLQGRIQDLERDLEEFLARKAGQEEGSEPSKVLL